MEYIKLAGYPPAQGVPKVIVNNYSNVLRIIAKVSLYPHIGRDFGTIHETYSDNSQILLYTTNKKET